MVKIAVLENQLEIPFATKSNWCDWYLENRVTKKTCIKTNSGNVWRALLAVSLEKAEGKFSPEKLYCLFVSVLIKQATGKDNYFSEVLEAWNALCEAVENPEARSRMGAHDGFLFNFLVGLDPNQKNGPFFLAWAEKFSTQSKRWQAVKNGMLDFKHEYNYRDHIFLLAQKTKDRLGECHDDKEDIFPF